MNINSLPSLNKNLILLTPIDKVLAIIKDPIACKDHPLGGEVKLP
jgi:hypothetical protein